MHVNGVIVAAGGGTRIGNKTPKPYLPLAGRPMILHTLDRFAGTRSIKKVVLVTGEKEIARCRKLLKADPVAGKLECIVTAGGPRRQDSVSLGLKRLDDDCEVVVIHDAARPLVSSRIIDECVEAAYKVGAVVVGIPVEETIKFVSEKREVERTPSREGLWRIQTPQVFRIEIIREAYRQANAGGVEATDDAMLVERLGKTVAVVKGDPENFKITYPQDLVLAELLIKNKVAKKK